MMKKLHNYIMRLTAIVLCLTLVSFYMVCGLYAKYTTQDNGSDTARVAAFVFNVNDTSNHFFDVSNVDAPGKSQSFTFTVCNFNGSVTSEVSEQYQIFAAIRGSLPLTVRIQDSTDASVIQLINGASEEKSSEKQSFAAGQGAIHTYTVTVSWPESVDETDLQYANAGISELVLRISAWQVD